MKFIISFSVAALAVAAVWAPLAAADTGDICLEPWPEGTEMGHLSDGEINESSGLAASWHDDDRLWTHNDSGDDPRLWAFDKTGQVSTEIRLVGAENRDWEDLAIGPCADGDEPCIYVAEIGDNAAQYDEVAIYRFAEPDLGDDPPATLDIDDWQRLRFVYEDGPRDAEALMVHPDTGQMWVIEKTGESPANIYEIPQAFDDDSLHEAPVVAALDVDAALPAFRMVVAADIAPDGSEFTYRTYSMAVVHCAGDGDDFSSAFESPGISATVSPATIQGESLAYDRDDGGVWLSAEGSPAPLIYLPARVADDADEDNGEDNGKDAGDSGGDSGDAGEEADAGEQGADQTSQGCATTASLPSLWAYLLAGLLAISGMAQTFRRALC